jgi:hypothetical protein
MSATRAPSGATLLAVAALLGATVAVAPAAAGCAAVRTRGAWTVAPYPPFADVAVATTTLDPGVLAHVLGLPAGLLAYGGPPSRALASNGVRVLRTTDSGCTWRRGYSIDPRDVADAAADPLVALSQPHAEYTIGSIAVRRLAPGATPAAGKDPVYAVVSNSDGWFTGVAVNAASQPYYVARSLDGGATWHTDLLQAKLEGAPVATPVTGSGHAPQVVVSPADLRTAYLLLDSRDPRSVDPHTPGSFGALYVTHDAGTTWSYVVMADVYSEMTPDPADPSTVYLAGFGTVDAVTAGPAVKRRNVFTAPPGMSVQSLDVVRPAHRPASYLVTTSAHDDTLNTWRPVLFRSVDGGKAWGRIAFDGVADLGGLGGGLVTGAWLTASGDVLAMRSIGGYGSATLMSYRWDARRRAWRRPVVEKPPLAAGFQSLEMHSFGPVDTAHRRFGFRGYQVQGASTYREVLGVYDSGR